MPKIPSSQKIPQFPDKKIKIKKPTKNTKSKFAKKKRNYFKLPLKKW